MTLNDTACGATKSLASRSATSIACDYFHVGFTVPDELNPLAVENPGWLYDRLCAASAQTLEAKSARLKPIQP